MEGNVQTDLMYDDRFVRDNLLSALDSNDYNIICAYMEYVMVDFTEELVWIEIQNLYDEGRITNFDLIILQECLLYVIE